jgi:glucose-1-phosphatase
MKRTVFFDLGNVLLFFDTLKMYRQIAEVCSLELAEVTALIQHQVDPYEKGLIDTKKVHEDFNRLTNKKIEFEHLRHAICNIFKPNESVIGIAKDLKKNDISLYILSNTCEAHFEFALEHFDFLQFFDGYVLSYQVGARKPEKKIFEEALKSANCDAHSCFYVDDIPEFVQAAKTMHIDAENYTTPERLLAHLYQRNFL